MISIYSIDVEHSESGTEVMLVCGEPGKDSSNPLVERHLQTVIAATVQPSPCLDDSR